MKKLFGAALITAILAFNPAAMAEKGGHGKGHGHEKHKDHDDRDNDHYVIVGGDRDRIRHYIVEDYQEHCPPGLAKKHNGCMPPGQYKKRYVIGRPLPSYVTYQPVPDYVLYNLEPVPVGYQYVRVDRDVLLINQASKHVIDAVTLLSAVNN